MEYWWLFVIIMVLAGTGADADRRRIRRLERKVGFLFRWVGSDPEALAIPVEYRNPHWPTDSRRCGGQPHLRGTAGQSDWQGIGALALVGAAVGFMVGLVVVGYAEERRVRER
jgi:hypothetical protein